MYQFLEVPYGSERQIRSVELRDRILRKPLGLQFSREDLAAEKNDHHLVALDGDAVVGVILMRVLDGTTIKMRQVAIDENLQRTGIGRKLVDFSERFSKEKGFQRIELHARRVAVPFYLKLGYHTLGDEFFEVGIPHFKMARDI